MASGHGLPARVHYENAHFVSAHSDFSRAVMQTMPSLHPSRPETFFLINITGLVKLNHSVTSEIVLPRPTTSKLRRA